MNEKNVMAAIIAAGIRANPEAMRDVKKASEHEKQDINTVIAIWANTQVEHILDERKRFEEEINGSVV